MLENWEKEGIAAMRGVGQRTCSRKCLGVCLATGVKALTQGLLFDQTLH